MASRDDVSIPISCALKDGQILWQIVEGTACYFSNLPAVSNKKEKQAKILLLHKAADTCSISRQTLAPHPLQKCFPMNLYPFTLKMSLIMSF